MKQYFNLFLVLFTTIVIAGCGNSSGRDTGEKVMLKFHPKEGESYQTNMEISSETKMMNMSLPMNINVGYTMLPTNVNDSITLVDVTYDNIYMKVESPMTGSVEYKSDSPSVAKGMGANKIKEIYDGIVGNTFTATFDKNGKVLNTTGSKNNLNKTMGAFSTATDMSQYLENLIATFPDRPVGKGDSWEKTVNAGGQMEIKSVYTVKKVTANTVELEIEGEVLPVKNDTGKVSVNLSGTLSGNFVVDRNTGWTNQGSITQNLDMDISQGMRKMSGKAENKILITSK